jgi:hypothetical protein
VKRVALLAAVAVASTHAGDFDESSFFQDSTQASAPGIVHTDTSMKAGANLVPSAAEAGPKVTFSGDLFAVGQASWRKHGMSTTSTGGSQVVGDAALEAGLSTGSRAMAIFEVDQDVTHDSTSFHAREVFVDGNVGNGMLWIRAGKQVLQWGRGILWTPTDLVNVEGKTLVARAGSREGASGVRLQVPVGQSANLYGFVNLAHVDAFDSLSAAWRAEAAVGPAEIAVSGWHKQNAPTALGVDGSTGILGWDVQAGAVWLSGDMTGRPVVDQNDQWTLVRDENRQQVRAGGGFGKAFTVLGDPERLRLDFEGFWQSDPIGAGVLKNGTRRDWATKYQASPTSVTINGTPLQASGPTRTSDEASFLVAQGGYVPNQLSWGYVAGMASFQKFFVQDLTLTLQALENLEDGSGLSTAALSWTTFHRFSASLTGYWFWGGRRDEETFLSGSGPALDARIGVRF